MKSQLSGRIEDTQFHNGTYTTILTEAAADAYSQPSSFKLRSDMELGPIGAEISVELEIRGFVRRKPYKDKQTGQPKVFLEDNTILSVTRVVPKAVTPPAAAVRNA